MLNAKKFFYNSIFTFPDLSTKDSFSAVNLSYENKIPRKSFFVFDLFRKIDAFTHTQDLYVT